MTNDRSVGHPRTHRAGRSRPGDDRRRATHRGGSAITRTAATITGTTRFHPSDCKGLARSVAFFEALSRFEGLGDTDAWEHADAIRQTLPDCDCFADSADTVSVAYAVTDADPSAPS